MKISQHTSFQRTSLLHKKGSLELSINAIVILILAITMLGLGLGFMKGLFSKTTKQLGEVGEDIKAQMIEQLRTSSAKLTLREEDVNIPRSETKDVYFAVKNVELSQPFGVTATCTKAVVPPPLDELAVIIADDPLDESAVAVGKMIIKIDANAERTTHSCHVCVNRGGPGDGCDYAKKSFFVTVQ